ncbi:YidC/Oxa1 family membrane protein insertase [Candidatus Contubernalis alkaliaceticus]|uniref:YidC/Oxa1 family membrane protein insertase n=1 Tax=Candidatus Contubernalis alkaliaceticus TaxID=338645 RepID=UPI001F4BF338|nr:YidC/Oxa1 family membrane protein insertase [Candidatus Contubernalis alkalaceticus]UNC91208.1 YidC/Oxa1 family membrane protein insertase [Candidatus Contubernalis alkalaceticus]
MNVLVHVFEWLFSMTNDYGMAIIGFTLFVKLLMLPLTIKQKRSMMEMRALTLQVDALKEKYKNNSEKLNEEIQKIYSEKSGAVSGIVLLFLQMPIFVMMYQLFSNHIVDAETVVLPWITSISVPDPFYILPFLYITIQLMPNILIHFDLIKNTSIPKLTKSAIAAPLVITLLFITNLPAGMGIYFVTSALTTAVEQIFIKV